jgi:hypothetical protein
MAFDVLTPLHLCTVASKNPPYTHEAVESLPRTTRFPMLKKLLEINVPNAVAATDTVGLELTQANHPLNRPEARL